MNELHLFAGCGGGILGGKLLGHTCVCAVEIEEYRRKSLLQRQRDGFLPGFPIWDDIRSFDGRPWRGIADVVAGGFPCTGISAAGKGEGLADPRSGLWSEMARVVCEVAPGCVFVENSPMLTSRGLGTVLGDLASLGFDAEWDVFSCADAAWSDGNPIADHERERLWILAVSDFEKKRRSEARKLRRGESSERTGGICSEVSVPSEVGCFEVEPRHGRTKTREGVFREASKRPKVGTWATRWWSSEPGVHGVADGVANRVDRLEAIGDGQVPAVVALAWTELMRRFDHEN